MPKNNLGDCVSCIINKSGSIQKINYLGFDQTIIIGTIACIYTNIKAFSYNEYCIVWQDCKHLHSCLFSFTDDNFNRFEERKYILCIKQDFQKYFRNKMAAWVAEENIFAVIQAQANASNTTTIGGCTCKSCGTPNNYAEPNQVDGSFVCFSCRSTF